MKYIVEARSEKFPSLYAMSEHGMAEISRDQAVRFTYQTAKDIAAREKRLRPTRKIVVIPVAK